MKKLLVRILIPLMLLFMVASPVQAAVVGDLYKFGQWFFPKEVGEPVSYLVSVRNVGDTNGRVNLDFDHTEDFTIEGYEVIWNYTSGTINCTYPPALYCSPSALMAPNDEYRIRYYGYWNAAGTQTMTARAEVAGVTVDTKNWIDTVNP